MSSRLFTTGGVKLRRLLFHMDLAELAGRSRQEAAKWLERAGASGSTNGDPHALAGELAPMPALDAIDALIREGDLAGAGSRLLDRFRETAPDRFFEGFAKEWAPTLVAQRLSSLQSQTTAAAEAICQGRFDLLGYRGLSFGDPIDWHLDPISGRRAPLVHWSRLDRTAPVAGGDSKVIWELNRHQWLVRLGQAYWLTADERYVERFAAVIQAWMQANPPGMGINWSSSLEVALRLISWCWALFFFRGSKALSPEFFLRLLGGIWAHATHIERYLSYYFAPNTHLTGEALGLFYAGVVFPELRSAERWRGLGAQILIEQSDRQVLPDGVYFEQATCYQRYTVEIHLHFLMLAARNCVPVPASVAERVQRMLDFLLAVRHGDGSIPQIGDADGGWLLPLTSRAPDDCRGIFSVAAALFGRADYAWAAGELAPEIAWLLGAAGITAVESIRPAPPPASPSRLFPHGGYAVMRSGWENRAHQLIFDVGPLGGPMSGHSHADLLSIQCTVFGIPYLVDPGTFCYSADSGWRDFFRSTAAHSTVMVDGVGQADPAGLFAWEERPQARLRRWRSTDAFDFADAEHDAYCRLPDPVLHRRRVLFMKKLQCWVLVDDLAGAAGHRVGLRFQLAPLPVTMDPTRWTRVQGPHTHGLLIRAFATVPLQAHLREGELNPKQGWDSPEYGQRRPAPVLIYSTTTLLPLRVVTLLVPTETPAALPPPVSPLVAEGPGGRSTIAGLLLGHEQELVRITEQDIIFPGR